MLQIKQLEAARNDLHEKHHDPSNVAWHEPMAHRMLMAVGLTPPLAALEHKAVSCINLQI